MSNTPRIFQNFLDQIILKTLNFLTCRNITPPGIEQAIFFREGGVVIQLILKNWKMKKLKGGSIPTK